MSIAAYIRTSTADQEGTAQLADLERAARNGCFCFTRVYKDKGQSGAKASRPELDALRRDVVRGKVTTLYVDAIDRLGRDFLDLLRLLRWFAQYKVEIISLQGETADFSNATAAMHTHMQAMFAEFERARGRERSAAWIAQAREKGIPLGRPVGRHKRATGWPARTPALDERVRKMRADNHSYSTIAEACGLPQTTVYRIIHPVTARRWSRAGKRVHL